MIGKLIFHSILSRRTHLSTVFDNVLEVVEPLDGKRRRKWQTAEENRKQQKKIAGGIKQSRHPNRP